MQNFLEIDFDRSVIFHPKQEIDLEKAKSHIKSAFPNIVEKYSLGWFRYSNRSVKKYAWDSIIQEAYDKGLLEPLTW